MNTYQEHALRLLDDVLLAPRAGARTLRSEQLLCRLEPLIEYASISPDEFCRGWAFSVGACFADALDCKLQQRTKDGQKYWLWTQGNMFAFRTGYTFHDTAIASGEPWGVTLTRLSYSLTITEAISCSTQTHESPRNPGLVTFQVHRPDRPGAADGQALRPYGETRTVTQDEFLRILIVGLPEKWR